MLVLDIHSVWKSPKMSQLNFSIVAFSTNFCPTKTDLSGNTVWPQASRFQKLAKLSIFGIFNEFLSTQNPSDPNGITPLHLAAKYNHLVAQNGYLTFVKYLVQIVSWEESGKCMGKDSIQKSMKENYV